MTWTYSDAPATVPRDAVRVLIGDTDSTWQQPVSDAEIAYFLTKRNNVVEFAASDAAEKLAAYYARQADTQNGKMQVSASQRSKQFQQLAFGLKMRALSAAPPTAMHAGGLSLAEKQTLSQNTDAVPPAFAIGMDDEPEASSPNASWPASGAE